MNYPNYFLQSNNLFHYLSYHIQQQEPHGPTIDLNNLYYNKDNPKISDADYDNLVKELKKLLKQQTLYKKKFTPM